MFSLYITYLPHDISFSIWNQFGCLSKLVCYGLAYTVKFHVSHKVHIHHHHFIGDTCTDQNGPCLQWFDDLWVCCYECMHFEHANVICLPWTPQQGKKKKKKKQTTLSGCWSKLFLAGRDWSEPSPGLQLVPERLEGILAITVYAWQWPANVSDMLSSVNNSWLCMPCGCHFYACDIAS